MLGLLGVGLELKVAVALVRAQQVEAALAPVRQALAPARRVAAFWAMRLGPALLRLAVAFSVQPPGWAAEVSASWAVVVPLAQIRRGSR